MQIEKLLEETAELSLEDQEILLEIIKKRLSEEKRNAIYKNFVEAKEDFRSGNVERGGVDELFSGIK
jgi:histone deacetylase complex regulatory component SIN3